MFQKIQKYLLVHQPLLWNMKIVPAIAFALLFHITFFIIGLVNGRIDFTKENSYDISDETTIFFSVLVSILFVVIWFVFYFRNNAYKSFYHLRPNHLFKEWLLLLLVCVLNVSYSISYLTGKTLRIRNYYSYEEVQRRCGIIDRASVFISSQYEDYTPPVDDNGNPMPRATISYNKVHYQFNSLMNKSGESFGINFDNKKIPDIKLLMQKNDTLAVKKMMADYLAIAHEHSLKSNLTVEKWFALTYHYPEFTKYEPIGRARYSLTGIVDEQSEKPAYLYYVPQNILVDNYETLSRNWDRPIISNESFWVVLYLALAISLVFFSFKVTNIRSWLIALVSGGILFVLMGIFSIVFRSESAFFAYWLVLFAIVAIHFFVKLQDRKDKGFSGISLNMMLWILTPLLPIVYGMLMEHFNQQTYEKIADGTTQILNTPEYEWLDANVALFAYLNILLVILMMWFLTTQIRKWKGLAES